ncbi:MAG: toxin-antitoxin system HicB family antitoxin [Bacillota bacterium]|nr:toxin-antitoxin system HicB family antitoxin [Bacillota bacterium]
MTVQDCMKLPYTRIIKPISDESGHYFVALALELDGCMTVGDTYIDAYKNLDEAMSLWFEDALENGDKIPACLDSEDYSGKFVLRIPKSLHRKLAVEAKLEGISLNQLALYKLAQ